MQLNVKMKEYMSLRTRFCLCCTRFLRFDVDKILFRIAATNCNDKRCFLATATMMNESRAAEMRKLADRQSCPRCKRKRLYFCYDCGVYMSGVAAIAPIVEVCARCAADDVDVEILNAISSAAADQNRHHQAFEGGKQQIDRRRRAASRARRDSPLLRRRRGDAAKLRRSGDERRRRRRKRERNAARLPGARRANDR